MKIIGGGGREGEMGGREGRRGGEGGGRGEREGGSGEREGGRGGRKGGREGREGREEGKGGYLQHTLTDNGQAIQNKHSCCVVYTVLPRCYAPPFCD